MFLTRRSESPWDLSLVLLRETLLYQLTAQVRVRFKLLVVKFLMLWEAGRADPVRAAGSPARLRRTVPRRTKPASAVLLLGFP